MFILLLLLIFIRPFISSLAFPYLDLIYSSLLMAFLAIWLLSRGLPLKEIKPIRYPLGLLCLALIISVVFSLDKLHSFIQLYKYIAGLLLFLIARSLNYENKMHILNIIILTGFIISLLAIYQYLFGFQHLSSYLAQYRISNTFILESVSQKRVFLPFVTPNILGGYLAMIIPLSLTQKKRTWFVVPFLSLALILTRSIGGLLSFVLGLAVYFSLRGKIGKRGIILLFGLIVIITLVLITRSINQKPHLQPIFSTIMRLNYWKDTLMIIKARPLTGIGLGNFNLAQSRFAHNSYLQIWAEMGILGFISVLWLITAIFKSALINIRKINLKNQAAILIAANIVFLIHNLVDFTFFLPEVALIWWLILGLTIAKE